MDDWQISHSTVIYFSFNEVQKWYILSGTEILLRGDQPKFVSPGNQVSVVQTHGHSCSAQLFLDIALLNIFMLPLCTGLLGIHLPRNQVRLRKEQRSFPWLGYPAKYNPGP
jgi:hypothetical protein